METEQELKDKMKQTPLFDEEFKDEPFAAIINKLFKDRMQRDRKFCKKIYSSLTNTDWFYKDDPKDHGYSFRATGSLIAAIREDGCYLDWYCSAPEGIVDPEIAEILEKHGWTYKKIELPIDNIKKPGIIKRFFRGIRVFFSKIIHWKKYKEHKQKLDDFNKSLEKIRALQKEEKEDDEAYNLIDLSEGQVKSLYDSIKENPKELTVKKNNSMREHEAYYYFFLKDELKAYIQEFTYKKETKTIVQLFIGIPLGKNVNCIEYEINKVYKDPKTAYKRALKNIENGVIPIKCCKLNIFDSNSKYNKIIRTEYLKDNPNCSEENKDV